MHFNVGLAGHFLSAVVTRDSRAHLACASNNPKTLSLVNNVMPWRHKSTRVSRIVHPVCLPASLLEESRHTH